MSRTRHVATEPRRRSLKSLVATLAVMGIATLALPMAVANAANGDVADPATSSVSDVLPQVIASAPADVAPMDVVPTSVPSTNPAPEPIVAQAQTKKDSTPYILTAWRMPAYTNDTTAHWPQTSPHSIDLATKDLSALDSWVAGQPYGCFQIDGSNDDATTASLIAGGHLDGPGNPPESLWGGGWGVAYKVVRVGAGCTPPVIKVTVAAPKFTPATCTAPGTVTGTNTDQYKWVRSGPDGAVMLSAQAVGTVTLTGQTVYGPYDLTQLTGEQCRPPKIPQCESTGSYVLNNGDFVYSDTRATGHYKFTETGLKIWTEGTTSTDKVAEYWTVNKPLGEIGQPSIDYSSDSGIKPGLQLTVDFDANGTTDGILVGESAYGDNWWLSNSAAKFVKDGAPHTGGGNGSNWYGTLAEWRAAFPHNNVVLGGFSLGSGVLASGVIHSVTMGCVAYTFQAPPKPRVCESFDASHSTNLDHNGWTLGEGATYVDGSIKFTVPGNWAEVAIERPFVGSLADIGTGVNFNPGTQYLGLHITLSNGAIITYEKESSYAGKWWSETNLGVASGMGYATFDTLENIVAANPDLTTTTLRVIYTSPIAANTTVTDVKVGCQDFTFGFVPPTSVSPAPPVWTDQCGPDNGQWSYSDTAQYVYTKTVNPDGSVTVTVAPKGWVVFPEGTITSWTEKDSNTACPTDRDVVTPVAPIVVPEVKVCTADYQVATTSGTVTIPVTTGGRYLLDGKAVSGTINLAPGTYAFAFEVVSNKYVLSDMMVNLTVVIKAAEVPSCVKPAALAPIPPVVRNQVPAAATDGADLQGSTPWLPITGALLLAGFIAGFRKLRSLRSEG